MFRPTAPIFQIYRMQELPLLLVLPCFSSAGKQRVTTDEMDETDSNSTSTNSRDVSSGEDEQDGNYKGILEWKDAQRLPWESCYYLEGLVASAIGSTGLAAWIVVELVVYKTGL